MTNAGLIKIAALLRDGGLWGDRSIVAPAWIRQMSSPRSLTPGVHDPAAALPRYAYSLGLWICADGSCYCDGTNGQHLVVICAGEWP